MEERTPETVEFYDERIEFLAEVLALLEGVDLAGFDLRDAKRFMVEDVEALLASEGLEIDIESHSRLAARVQHDHRGDPAP